MQTSSYILKTNRCCTWYCLRRYGQWVCTTKGVHTPKVSTTMETKTSPIAEMAAQWYSCLASTPTPAATPEETAAIDMLVAFYCEQRHLQTEVCKYKLSKWCYGETPLPLHPPPVPLHQTGSSVSTQFPHINHGSYASSTCGIYTPQTLP